jgi:hypothetical protein
MSLSSTVWKDPPKIERTRSPSLFPKSRRPMHVTFTIRKHHGVMSSDRATIISKSLKADLRQIVAICAIVTHTPSQDRVALPTGV